MSIIQPIIQPIIGSIVQGVTGSSAVAIPDSLIRLQEMYVERDGSGGEASTSDLVGYIQDISGNANHAVASSDAARGTKTAGGFSLDGVNDIYEMPKPSGDVSDCTVLMRWRRLNDDSQGVVLSDGTGSRFLATYQSGDSNATYSGSGIPITNIDGVTMTTRDDIYDASASSCDMIITSANLSAWAGIKIAGWNGGSSSYMPNIEIADRGLMIFDHTPTDAEIAAAFASMGTLS